MRKFLLGSGLVIWLFFGWTLSFAEGNPTEVLSSIADRMISSLKAHQTTLKSNPSLVYSLTRKIVVPYADLDEMSKRVLPAATWASATPVQRQQFEREFTTILVRTYASALAEYKDQTVRFYPVRGGSDGKNSVTVNGQIIRSDGPPVAVSFRMINRGSGWRVYDMNVEGVSMLQSFHSQFADKLSQGDMAELLRSISSHNSDNSGN